MVYERYPRGTQPGDYYNYRGENYGSSFGPSDNSAYSSARDYEAVENDRGGRSTRGPYGARPLGQRDGGGARGDRDATPYRGSYAHDGHRFEDVGRYSNYEDDNRQSSRARGPSSQRGYGRQPEGYDYDERGFVARAGDEVRSWFGDDEAERRREYDARYDERHAHHRDADYHNWRNEQISALDRDYAEYRQENQTKFHNEFSAWRSGRQTQRDALSSVQEHAEVVGSDGEHVGTVDKVRGDRILLTKNDKDAGGIHHSIPSRWIDTADASKVTLSKSATEAKQAWRDEERSQAMFGDGDNAKDRDRDESKGSTLSRSYPGTY